MMIKEDMTVIRHEELANDICLLVLKGELVTHASPGQFVHVRVSEKGMAMPLLRRPISISDIDLEQMTMSIIYRVEGEGTRRLAKQKVGEIVDVLGPLGQGFETSHLTSGDNVLIVGGGVGVPPLYYLSQTLVQQGCKVTHVLGYQTKNHSFLVHSFETLGETHVTTVDGSLGTQGFVTNVIDRWPLEQWDSLFACGPTPMLKALEERFLDHSNAFLSLEERMGCGIGACFACVCQTPSEQPYDYRKVCTDGPVFRVGEVIL
ncbi:dihydroorotate dehydrogenase electron transfer subunit [Caldalkalibacillus salinus]|uniref:dihydroorotate dehydrogenase electron transfer subunit n=1 Tax=Caldalkalibacillus salinus TaxID=2803787 RepID=UPI001920D8F8|nr:dihydroorotate dehydrogenase electron transfer subunit [Caldalkalibacillus salinus]